eukprot:3663770-Lingulodinium_polyedra.AAC.1
MGAMPGRERQGEGSRPDERPQELRPLRAGRPTHAASREGAERGGLASTPQAPGGTGQRAGAGQAAEGAVSQPASRGGRRRGEQQSRCGAMERPGPVAAAHAGR